MEAQRDSEATEENEVVRTTVQLSEDLRAELRDLAQREQRTQSEVIRDALAAYLGQRRETRPWADPTGGDFYQRIADPASWLGTARAHLLLAEKLHSDLDNLIGERPPIARYRETVALVHGFAFFIGAAIENGLKAIIVRRKPHLVKPRGLSKKLSHHRLPELAALAGLIPNRPYTEQRLKNLTHFIEWAARYPSAKTATGMAAAKSELSVDPDGALELAREVVEIAAREAGENL